MPNDPTHNPDNPGQTPKPDNPPSDTPPADTPPSPSPIADIVAGATKAVLEAVKGSGSQGGQAVDQVAVETAVNKAVADNMAKVQADHNAALKAERDRAAEAEKTLADERDKRTFDTVKTTLGVTDDRLVKVAIADLGDTATDAEAVNAWALEPDNAKLLGKPAGLETIKTTLGVSDDRVAKLILGELGTDATDKAKVKAWAERDENRALVAGAKMAGPPTGQVPAPSGGDLGSPVFNRLGETAGDPNALPHQRQAAQNLQNLFGAPKGGAA